MPSDVSPEGFQQAVLEALESGREEIARLADVGEMALASYQVSPSASTGVPEPLLSEFAVLKRGFAHKVLQHISEQRDVLATFNVAFFGRTGAGKSTLLSAFGELDGHGVSWGDSDWTKEVESIGWRGCRLYDTPGINGWGGRASREVLEARARRAVEIADVVLLCFDSQSQQASEFSKVADWVRHYGKPTVAVLNIRNLRWRHPAKVPNQTARRNISEPVRQHYDNIRTELSSIGLTDTPIVAIHSHRALFARASTPYRGPAERDFHSDREQFGIDYLARWSNFAALEALLTAIIASGGSRLRLTSLREGMRAILRDEARSLQSLSERLTERANEADRAVTRELEVLGYLEEEKRAARLHDPEWCGDLLTLAESARGAPYQAAAEGTFSRHVQTLLKAQLSVPRSNALRRFKDLEHNAFDAGKDVNQENFARAVFDESEIQSAVDDVWVQAAAFLERELSMATAELAHKGASVERDTTPLAGAAGSSARDFEKVLKTSGLLTGSTAGLLGVVALTNAWNPAGWVAATVLAGLGAVSQVMGWFGGKQGANAEKQRSAAHAKAAYAGRTAIQNTFDRIEQEFRRDACTVVWDQAAPAVQSLLRELVALNLIRDEIAKISRRLDDKSNGIPSCPPTDLLREAEHQLLQTLSADDSRDVNRILKGEDWFDADAVHGTAVVHDEAFMETCRRHRDADAVRLREHLRSALSRPTADRVAEWIELITAAAEQDPTLGEALAAALPLGNTKPIVTVAGDFSAGKSSFIKRLIVEMGGDIPDTLRVRADPTTDAVHVYHLDRVSIIDTPGFQSGREAHDDRALTGISGAALVIVLLHVNLLIGDTARLEGIVKGTDSAPGKWPRMLFLINRCDELGVDPVNDIDEYYTRRERKIVELRAALASRGIAVSAESIHGVASDPFSSVGDQSPVTRGDYDANRDWDGIDGLVDAIAALSPEELAQAVTLASVDKSCENLLADKARTQSEIQAQRDDADKLSSLSRALTDCQNDASYLESSIKQTLTDKVGHHVRVAMAQIRELNRGDEKGLSAQAVSWINKELQSEVEKFMEFAAEEIEAWASVHQSAINRAFAAAAFAGSLGLPTAQATQNGDTVGDATKAATFVTEAAQKFAAALGNRDAVYWIGKNVGRVKFKPWGAVKAGRSVARVGVVLQAAAVILDTASWIRTEMQRSDWETEVDEQIEAMEAAASEKVDDLLYGPDGPLKYLKERRDEIAAIQSDYNERCVTAKSALGQQEQRFELLTELLAAADDMRKDRV
jgi:predicted GTPase